MKTFYLIPLMFLSACSTTPKVTLRPQSPPPAGDNSAVRYPEVVRAYHVGRYVDPNDDLVMHEGHVVYRVEDNARWDLHPAAEHPGPVVGSPVLPAPSRDAAFSPTPVNDAILAEVNAQRLATVQIELEAQTLAGALARFQSALHQTKTNWQQMAALRLQVNDMQLQLNTLKAAQARMVEPPAPPATNPPPDEFFDTNSDQFNP